MDPPPGEPSSSTGASSSAQAEGGSLSRNKHKHPTDDPLDDSDPSLSHTKKSWTCFASWMKKPKKTSDWHFRKGEVPKAAVKTKLALELHLCVLWGLPDQVSVPPTVTAADMVPFNRCFSIKAHVRSSVTASLDKNSVNIQGAEVKVRDLLNLLPDGGIISNNIRCISDINFKLIFRTVASSGLWCWAPDVLGGNPDSMYNLLHKHIALTTFEQITVAQGYCHTGQIESFVWDFVLMHKLYWSFVFSYMHGIAKLESKEKGSASGKRGLVLETPNTPKIKSLLGPPQN
ncbi:hypothetical protein B0H34DRAFT_813571 [Crassisporium funariophilum]|nr:hypothetical protein B0H34DRAFT_813571 [Crassisporium funariophilum]